MASILRVPLVVEVHPWVEARTVPDFPPLAKANPGQPKVANADLGTLQHLGIELFKMMVSVDLILVPCLGSVPNLAELLNRQVRAILHMAESRSRDHQTPVFSQRNSSSVSLTSNALRDPRSSSSVNGPMMGNIGRS